MRICLIGTRGYPYVYSGYETFAKELCERLVKDHGFEVTIYCHRNLFKDRPEYMNGIRLKYFWSPQQKVLSQLVHSFQSMIHACFVGYDVIFVVNSANGPFGLLSRLFRRKTAINVDGLEWLRPKWKGIGAKYFYWSSRLSTKLYDHIINDSEAMRQIYLDDFGTDSTVIAYGANIRHSENQDLIKEWNLEPRNYYLVVGRLIPDNNADLIVREFIKSKSSKKLVIVGDVPYKDQYAERIKQTSDARLLFTGYVKDQAKLAELYHNCFAYFHGHEFGGTNPTMLKALAYGCSVIALDTPFTREMLKNDEYGLFFTKEEGVLEKLIENCERNLEILEDYRMKSRKRIQDNYTWDKITNEYNDLFQKIRKVK